jgi:hypothetical protein
MSLEQLQEDIREQLGKLEGLGEVHIQDRHRQLEAQLGQQLGPTLIEELAAFADQFEHDVLPHSPAPDEIRAELTKLRNAIDRSRLAVVPPPRAADAPPAPPLAETEASGPNGGSAAQLLPGEEPFSAVVRIARGDRFQQLKQLQAGAIAVGFAGVDRTTGEQIVLKVPAEQDPLKQAIWSSPELLAKASASIEREAHILNQIYQPLCDTTGSARPVRPIDWGAVRLVGLPPVQWTVQTFAPGQRLSAGMLPMSGIGERTAVTILRQVTTMTLRLFELGITHGDLKPDALFWQAEQNQLHVIDWNAARSGIGAADQQHEFEIVRRLAITVLGGLNEARLTVRDLFFSPSAPDLSRGARLLLLRLGKDATPRPFTALSELDAALGELEHTWTLTDSPLRPAATTDLATLTQQQNVFSVALLRNQSSQELAELIRKNQGIIAREALFALRNWRRHDGRATYERLLLEPTLQLPDLAPLGLFGLFFHDWIEGQPRDRDRNLEPLLDALQQEQSAGEVHTQVAALRDQVGEAGFPTLQLLADVVRATEQLAQADGRAAEDTVQARQLLGEAALLKSGPLYRVVSQRIEHEQRLLVERARANESIKQLQQKAAKTAEDQRQLLRLLEQHLASRLVTQAQVEEQRSVVAKLNRYHTQLQQQPAPLQPLWEKRHELEDLAVDIAAHLAEGYYQALSESVTRQLTEGPITSAAVQPHLQHLNELAQYAPAGPDLRARAQLEQSDLTMVIQIFEELSKNDGPVAVPQEAVTPNLGGFYDTLIDAAKRRAVVSRLAGPNATGAFVGMAESLLGAAAPTSGQFAGSLAAIDGRTRRLAGDTLATKIAAAIRSPELDTAAIESALKKLAEIDAAQASVLQNKLEQQQRARLNERIQRLERILGEHDQRFIWLETKVASLQAAAPPEFTVVPTPPPIPSDPRLGSGEDHGHGFSLASAPLSPNPPQRLLHPIALWSLVGLAVVIGAGLLTMIGFQIFGAGGQVAVATSASPTGTVLRASAEATAPSTGPTVAPPNQRATQLPEADPTTPPLAPTATITVSNVLIPGATYTVTSSVEQTASELLLTIGDLQRALPITTDGESRQFTLPVNLLTSLELTATLPLEGVRLSLGDGSTTSSLGVYTTTVNAAGLALRTSAETFSYRGQTGIYLWQSAIGEEVLAVPNGVGKVVLSAGDQVEILALQGDRYKVRILTNQLDRETVVNTAGWVRRVLIDGPAE